MEIEQYSDLDYALSYAGLHGNDVVDVLATIEGANDYADWHWILVLSDGEFGYLTGGCDYTGWD